MFSWDICRIEPHLAYPPFQELLSYRITDLIDLFPCGYSCLKGVFFRFKPAVWCTSINRYHGFRASLQDYEGYEFVECLSEETQTIVLFTHC